MSPDIRAITDDEWPAFVRTSRTAFGMVAGESDWDPAKRDWPLERSVAAFEDGEIVGTAGAFDFDLTLPGLTTAPAAGVTWVGVLPTHTRRGVLSSMMRYQLDDVHERGEPLAVLLASESLIYGRYGYGLATTQVDWTLDTRHARLVDPSQPSPGRVRLLPADEAAKTIPAVYDRARLGQVGEVRRPDAYWQRVFRPGSDRFYVVYESSSGSADGFAFYRVKTDGPMLGLGSSTVVVQGLGGVDAEAYLGLWRYLFTIDLTRTITTSLRPIDEPLRWMLADPRQLTITRAHDFLWCRIVDLPAALIARRFVRAGRLTIEVADRVCGWNDGTWVLEVGETGEATCHRGDRGTEADLSCTVADLGAVFLGGTRWATLKRAGRVAGDVALADAMFAAAAEPWTQTFF